MTSDNIEVILRQISEQLGKTNQILEKALSMIVQELSGIRGEIADIKSD